MLPRNRPAGKLGRAALLGALAASLAGCHPAGEAAAPASPTATPAQQASEVQSNPNIPPQAKAHITQQMRGQAPPPVPAAPTHP